MSGAYRDHLTSDNSEIRIAYQNFLRDTELAYDTYESGNRDGAVAKMADTLRVVNGHPYADAIARMGQFYLFSVGADALYKSAAAVLQHEKTKAAQKPLHRVAGINTGAAGTANVFGAKRSGAPHGAFQNPQPKPNAQSEQKK